MGSLEENAVLFAKTHLAPLAARASRQVYGKGSTIILRGEALQEAYFIVRGTVEAQYSQSKHHNCVMLRPGDFFGEDCVMDDGLSQAHARAADPDTWVLGFPAEALQALLDRDAALKRTLLAQVARRRMTFACAAPQVDWPSCSPN